MLVIYQALAVKWSSTIPYHDQLLAYIIQLNDEWIYRLATDCKATQVHPAVLDSLLLSVLVDNLVSYPVPHALTRNPKLVSTRFAPAHRSEVTLCTRKEFQRLLWIIRV